MEGSFNIRGYNMYDRIPKLAIVKIRVPEFPVKYNNKIHNRKPVCNNITS